jgi:kynurenine 3-monooxygenase
MHELQNERSVIVGGGLVGSLLSIFLVRRDAEVTVYEAREDPRGGGGEGGRSINLVVTTRGLRALERVGLKAGALRLTVPVTGRMVHGLDGAVAYQPYGRDETECNHSISRAELNRFLIEEAEKRGVRFRFRSPLVRADIAGGRLEFEDAVAGRRNSVEAPIVFGADGAMSVVRAELMKLPGNEEFVEPLQYGYKELVIPPGKDGTHRITKNALHIWPRGDLMLMALPNRDGSFTVTLYLPHEGEHGFDGLDSESALLRFFETFFPNAIPLIPDLLSSFFENPTGTLGTVRCRPWFLRDRVALIGDAAHAVVPFFGQGMNCGFEDCAVLDELIGEYSGDWILVLRRYGEMRKTDADAIADMALDNFVEMRDRVGDPRFLLRKQLEHKLEERWPREYRSRYSMVMYSSIPYSVAQRAGKIQDEILAQLLDGMSSVDDLDYERARELIERRLTPFLEEHSVVLNY